MRCGTVSTHTFQVQFQHTHFNPISPKVIIEQRAKSAEEQLAKLQNTLHDRKEQYEMEKDISFQLHSAEIENLKSALSATQEQHGVLDEIKLDRLKKENEQNQKKKPQQLFFELPQPSQAPLLLLST